MGNDIFHRGGQRNKKPIKLERRDMKRIQNNFSKSFLMPLCPVSNILK